MAFKLRKALVTTAIVLPGALVLALAPPDSGTGRLKPKVSTRAVTSSAPSGYEQVGNTELFFNSANFDFYGRIGNSYYGSTYGNNGYWLSIKVNSNSAQMINSNQSTTTDGVTCTPRVEQQGEFGRVVYSVYNGNETDAVVSLGTYADVMIGSNDYAPISRRVDMIGATYGVSMKDNGAAQLCVLFGSGLAGVNGVDDFWFGYYSQNRSPSEMVGNYTQGGNFMVENGGYDSGMGWCWKNRTVPAGETVEFSYLIGVGDVNLEPTSSFTTTLENIDPWNDLTQVQTITINGEYESPAGQNGRIEYSVEDSEEWSPLTDELTSGSEFSTTLSVKFTPYKSNHVIRFRTVDIVGNTTMLNPIVYKDVYYYTLSGVKSLPYNFGEPVYQTDVECALPAEQYKLTNYSNNTGVGTASFKMEGVFPYTNGFKEYTFNITPRELEGEIIVDEGEYVYTGSYVCPTWSWSDERFANLVEGVDYTVSYSDNYFAGTATVAVYGRGNFTGSIEGHFTINKAPLDWTDFDIRYEEDAIYTGYEKWIEVGHGSYFLYDKGKAICVNTSDGTTLQSYPKEPGKYDIYLTVDENLCYLDTDTVKIGEMNIYALNQEDFNNFQNLRRALEEQVELSWPETPDAISVATQSYDVLKFSEGRITELNLAWLGLVEIPEELYALNRLTSLNLYGNKLSGNISDIVNRLPLLTKLDVRGNKFTNIDSPLPERISTSDFLFCDQEIDMDLNLSDFGSQTFDFAAIARLVPNIVLYNPYQRNFTCSQICFYNFGSPWWIREIKTNETGGIEIDDHGYAIPDYHGKSGDIIRIGTQLKNSTDEMGETDNFQYLNIKLSFSPGDVNFNGTVDIADLQTIIRRIFGRDTPSIFGFNFTAADLWEDETLNVQDIVMHTNILTDYRPEADNATRRHRSLAADDADVARVYCRDGQLIIDSPIPVAAFDIVVTGNSAQLTAQMRSLGFTAAVVVKDGYAHIVGYSLSGAEIPAGQYAVADVDDSARAYSCTLSDIEANIIPSATGQHTGIDGAAISGTRVHLDGNSLYLTTANGVHTRWSVHTTAGTPVAAGECETVAGTNLLTTLDSGITAVAIVTVETDGERIVTKIVTGQHANN
ncbi:MAG: hypothetical protein NC117_09265 [Pseudoflavonifractor sp.]|nr:hypothetical protein [Pseudoflavonifractor sp.]